MILMTIAAAALIEEASSLRALAADMLPSAALLGDLSKHDRLIRLADACEAAAKIKGIADRRLYLYRHGITC